jgi:uncharacterized protein (DUF697 family)
VSIPQKYEDAAVAAVLAAGATGVAGVVFPLGDIAAMTGIWTTLTVRVAQIAEQPVDRAYARRLAAAAAVGTGAYVTGSKLFSRLLFGVPGGILAAAGINSGLNALYTWQFAEVLVELFDDDARADDVLTHIARAVGGMRPQPRSFADMIRALTRWLSRRGWSNGWSAA